MQHYGITTLLGLEEFRQTFVHEMPQELIVGVIKNSSAEVCPHCHSTTTYVHDRRKQMIKDLPIRCKPVRLELIKRRFRCLTCGHVFSESYQSIKPYQRMTERLIEHIGQAGVRDSFRSVGQQLAISDTTVRRYFDRQSTVMVPALPPLAPRFMAIDEFAGTTREGQYHLAIGDAANRELIDILRDRKKEAVIEYLKRLPEVERVEAVVIDMWRPYREAVHKVIPKAKVIADRFHVIRNANWALEAVRKKVGSSKGKGFRLTMKHSRFLLLANPEHLTPEKKQRLDELLSQSEELRTAYRLKESIRVFYESRSLADATKKLTAWYEAVEASSLPAFSTLARTVRNWETEILNFFDTRLTNGFIEGTNNRLKAIKRQAYGFRNFQRYRCKALLACRKQPA
jgi:transposase